MKLLNQRLNEQIRNTKLEKYSSFLSELIRPAVNIIKINKKPDVGESKFGGFPDIPEDFKWPKHQYGKYRFLCQINFKEIQKSHSILPENGLLSLFVADLISGYDEPEIIWGDPGYIIGFYFDNIENLERKKLRKLKQEERAIEFKNTIDLPFQEELVDEWPLNEDEKDFLFYELRSKLKREGDYLLGYPQYNTLAYNPLPGDEWISLLALHSHDDLDWCWGDGDRLMIFIEKNTLKEKDFSNLGSDAG